MLIIIVVSSVQLMDNLNIPVRPSKMPQDTRKCILCQGIGDDVTNGPGRSVSPDSSLVSVFWHLIGQCFLVPHWSASLRSWLTARIILVTQTDKNVRVRLLNEHLEQKLSCFDSDDLGNRPGTACHKFAKKKKKQHQDKLKQR